jgi:hypothetical protein
MSLELRDYMLTKRINSKCGDNTTLVLYFLSSSSCPDCRAQGDELTKAREQGSLRVYSFDMDINNSLTQSLMQMHKIDKYPTTIISDKKHEGYLTSQEILNAAATD